MQVSDMRFLQKIVEVTMFDKVCTTVIREPLNIESPLLHIVRSQLGWFGHVSRISKERLPKQTLYAKVNRN